MVDIYRGRNPIDVPAYSLKEASRLIAVPAATVRSWVLGRGYPTRQGVRKFAPLVEIADPKERYLSFRNLVELHVLSAIRRSHGVKLDAVRDAVQFLKERFGSAHPLADFEMQTDGANLFVERYGKLVHASREGQMMMKNLFGRYLKRIDRDPVGVAIRLYPFTTTLEDADRRTVVIDPRVQFGRPYVAGTGTPTAVIAERFRAGDSPKAIAEDVGLDTDAVEEAIRYEIRAA